jgi:hypothetical protein
VTVIPGAGATGPRRWWATAGTRPGWVGPVLTAWLVSRVVVAAGLLLGAPDDLGRWAGFEAWDGQWYLRTANDGYGDAPSPGLESSWPFFPLLPALLRAVDAAGLSAPVGLVVVNHVVFALGLVGVWRLAERRCGAEVASRAVWVLALFPASAVFSMVYPESIYLAASAWAFDLADHRRWVGAGLVAAVATMVRPNGAILVFVVTLSVFVASAPASRWRRAAVVVAPSAALFVGWLVVGAVRTGDPLVFVTAKSAWEERTLFDMVRNGLSARQARHVVAHVALAAFAAVALVVSWRRLPRMWRLLGTITLATPLLTGVIGVARYTNSCFPLAVALAVVVSRCTRTVRSTLAVGSTAALVALAFAVAGYRFLP